MCARIERACSYVQMSTKWSNSANEYAMSIVQCPLTVSTFPISTNSQWPFWFIFGFQIHHFLHTRLPIRALQNCPWSGFSRCYYMMSVSLDTCSIRRIEKLCVAWKVQFNTDDMIEVCNLQCLCILYYTLCQYSAVTHVEYGIMLMWYMRKGHPMTCRANATVTQRKWKDRRPRVRKNWSDKKMPRGKEQHKKHSRKGLFGSFFSNPIMPIIWHSPLTCEIHLLNRNIYEKTTREP